MLRDPIVSEVRKHREAYAQRLNYDLRAICADLRAQQKQGKRQVVSLPCRSAATTQP